MAESLFVGEGVRTRGWEAAREARTPSSLTPCLSRFGGETRQFQEGELFPAGGKFHSGEEGESTRGTEQGSDAASGDHSNIRCTMEGSSFKQPTPSAARPRTNSRVLGRWSLWP